MICVKIGTCRYAEDDIHVRSFFVSGCSKIPVASFERLARVSTDSDSRLLFRDAERMALPPKAADMLLGVILQLLDLAVDLVQPDAVPAWIALAISFYREE